MARVVYGSGKVTVAVDGTLEQSLRAAFNAASKGLASGIEALVDEVAEDARQDWYDQVDKRSGDSQESIETEMRLTTDKVTGVVYATEKATYMIKRPGPLSVLSTRKLTQQSEYFEVRDYYRKNKAMPPGYRFAKLDENGDPVGVRAVRPNPKASDGKSMWQENVIKPGKKRARDSIRSIQRATKAALKGGRSG
jgi:hypothetical protein